MKKRLIGLCILSAVTVSLQAGPLCWLTDSVRWLGRGVERVGNAFVKGHTSCTNNSDQRKKQLVKHAEKNLKCSQCSAVEKDCHTMTVICDSCGKKNKKTKVDIKNNEPVTALNVNKKAELRSETIQQEVDRDMVNGQMADGDGEL